MILTSRSNWCGGFCFFPLPTADYEDLPTQDSQEDFDMLPDIYSSPTEYFQPENQVQYCLHHSFTSLC